MNVLNVISPYRSNGVWMFDDAARGLLREPFVCGADAVLDVIADGADRLTLVFSATPFPGHELVLEWQGEESGGHWYRVPKLDMAGWLCPALLKYFECAPERIYVARKAVLAEQDRRQDAQHQPDQDNP